MIKIVAYLIFIALFVYIAGSPVGVSAISWMGSFFASFYNDALVYSSPELWGIFAIFLLIVGYWIIK